MVHVVIRIVRCGFLSSPLCDVPLDDRASLIWYAVLLPSSLLHLLGLPSGRSSLVVFALFAFHPRPNKLYIVLATGQLLEY
jgi:hypothetical protein